MSRGIDAKNYFKYGITLDSKGRRSSNYVKLPLYFQKVWYGLHSARAS